MSVMACSQQLAHLRLDVRENRPILGESDRYAFAPGCDNLATFASEVFGRKGQACFRISFFSSFPGFAEFCTN